MPDSIVLHALRLLFQTAGRVAPGPSSWAAWHLFRLPLATVGTPSEREQAVRQEAERGEVVHRERRLATYRWAPQHAEEQGRVLLVHSWGARATALHPLITALRHGGFEVVSFDAPGHGASEGRVTSALDTAGAASRVAEAAGPVRVVVGHSFGGFAASVLVAGFDAAEATVPPLDAERVALLGAPNNLGEITRRFAELVRLPAAVTRRVYDHVEAMVDRPAGAVSAGRLLARADVPALVIHDRDDREVPYADAVAMTSEAPRAQLHTTTGLGHRRILRDAEVLSEVVSFLQETPAHAAALPR